MGCDPAVTHSHAAIKRFRLVIISAAMAELCDVTFSFC
jgi:hypothetical protein